MFVSCVGCWEFDVDNVLDGVEVDDGVLLELLVVDGGWDGVLFEYDFCGGFEDEEGVC